jgi:hypothetical protein
MRWMAATPSASLATLGKKNPNRKTEIRPTVSKFPVAATGATLIVHGRCSRQMGVDKSPVSESIVRLAKMAVALLPNSEVLGPTVLTPFVALRGVHDALSFTVTTRSSLNDML